MGLLPMGLMPWAAQPRIPPVTLDISKVTVAIATPTRGREVGDNYRRNVDELRELMRNQVKPLGELPALRDGEQYELFTPKLTQEYNPFGLTGTFATPHDLVHTRDRAMRFFVEWSTADWLLFWDDDVWGHDVHRTLASMLTMAVLHNVHIIGALYPAKRPNLPALIRAVQEGKTDPMRHMFSLADMRFTCPVGWKPDYLPEHAPNPWLMSVLGVGMGFTLISRVAAIALTERYRVERSWTDRLVGGKTVSLFHKLLEDGESYSEDYSFCVTAARAGFGTWAYMGPGAPLVHDGVYSFDPDPLCLQDGHRPGGKE